MFGSGKRLDTLEQQLAAMEEQIAEVHGDTEAHVEREVTRRLDVARADLDDKVAEFIARAEQEPDARARLLLNSIADELRDALQESLDRGRLINETLEEVKGVEASARALHDQIEAKLPSQPGGLLRAGVCPECNHREVIMTGVVEFCDRNEEYPMSVTYNLLGGDRAIHEGFGELTLFTCRSCGFSQWYAAAPDQIPIGDKYRTQLIQG